MDELDKGLEKLSADILASYRCGRETQRIGEMFLPSRQKIVETLTELRRLVFPGYFGRKALTDQNISFHVGNLIVQVSEALAEQVCYCLCYVENVCEAAPCREKAGQITHDLMAAIPKIRDLLADDVQAAYDGDPAAKGLDEVIFCYPGFYAVFVYRIAHELLTLGVPLMPRIMTEHAHSVTGCDIHPGAQIGRRFFIDHATGVVIGETTRIADNVKIYQGVTLGAKSFPKDERGRVIRGLPRHPSIEDNVTIYPNATILGGQTIVGKGAVISGNSYVTQSVEAGSVVKPDAPKLRVLSRKKPTSKEDR